MIMINVDNSNNSSDLSHTCVCLILTTGGYGGLGRGGGQGGLVPGGAGYGAGMRTLFCSFSLFLFRLSQYTSELHYSLGYDYI